MNYLYIRLKLFSLWLFVMLNIVFRDIHQLTMKSHLEMLLTGFYNGVEITDEIMLFGAFLVNIAISMLLVTIILERKINRLLNIIAAIVFSSSFFLSPPTDMDDLFHFTVQMIAIVAIILTSFKWQEFSLNPKNAAQV